MDLRLFLFLVVLVLTMLIGVVAILFVSGTFSAGLSQSEKLVQNDLDYLSNGMSEQFGFLSQHVVEFSKSLSSRIEAQLEEKGYTTSNLQEHPDLLKEILFMEFERALSRVLRSNSSGGFIILDATINPALANAENYRGRPLHQKYGTQYCKLLFAQYPYPSRPSKHRTNELLPLHAQWDMEFDIRGASTMSDPCKWLGSRKRPFLSSFIIGPHPLSCREQARR